MYKIKANIDKQLEACGEACSHFYSMCGSRFYSMKVTQEVRGFAAKQNQPSDAFIAAEGLDAEAGMKAMSDVFKEEGGEIYPSVE